MDRPRILNMGEANSCVALVNRQHRLSEMFTPRSLVDVGEIAESPALIVKGKVRLVVTAAIALCDAAQRCLAAGAGPIVLLSGYRSYKEQQALHLTKIQRLLDSGMDIDAAREEAARIVAPPGASEHQLGLAMDLATPWLAKQEDPLTGQFADTVQGRWLREHAHELGLVLRYPPDKCEVTGIIFEPWHYRYVGLAHSAAMRDKCLEEYVRSLTSSVSPTSRE